MASVSLTLIQTIRLSLIQATDRSPRFSAMASMIESIIAQGQRLATHSWEFGTFAEALLEWYDPDLAVFSSSAFPDGKIPVLNVADVRSLSYAQPLISTNSTTFIDGDGKPIRVERKKKV